MTLKRRLASQSTLLFGARIGGAGLVFLVQAAIARLWGAEILGEYLVTIAVVNLIAVGLPLGFHTVGTYFAAEYRAKADGAHLRRFLSRSYLHVLGLGLLVAIAGMPIVGHFGSVGAMLAQHWIPVTLLAIATAIVYVNGAALVGLKHPVAGFLADTIFRPLSVIAAFVIALAAGSPGAGFTQMLWIVGFAYVAIAVVQCGVVLKVIADVPSSLPMRTEEPRRWWRFAMPWIIISLATDFFFDIDLLLLSGHLSREELAIFGVCTRVFSLVSFGVAAVYAVTLPDIFESEALKDRAGFNRKVGDANLVAAGLALALFVLMAGIAPIALQLFGPAFISGAAPLAILCLALVVRAVFGPASMVLSIHDRPFASLPAVGLGMGTLVVANLILVPPFGLVGAATAALLSTLVWSVVLRMVAQRIAGVDVSILPRLRQFAMDRHGAPIKS
jgi:O-antigen/teichoic acid export membrane protein